MTLTSPYSRQNPCHSFIKERFLLTGPASSKKTYHISLEIPRENFQFKVGDTVGIFPENHPEEVDQILAILKVSKNQIFEHPKYKKPLPIQELLLKKLNITKLTSSLLKSFIQTESQETLSSFSLLDILKRYPANNLSFLSFLSPLLPRFYSIANSPLVSPGEIHLTLALPSYIAHGETRFGVASQFLCQVAETRKTPISIYLQPAEHFTLPKDPKTPIILIGPGTGIAPFRAFLQERALHPEAGPSWLFFGERNRSSDFYYEDFFSSLANENKLKLDLAFSQDTPHKVYVQHKLYEHKALFWQWLQQGASLYICGRADTMAKDVEATLLKIIQEEALLSPDAARLHLRSLRADKRYLLDVY
jgi:sulfite reductase (NADPH) flavoprotein alpha-component